MLKTSRQLTLFVTVLANLLRFMVLSFSHSKFVYICRTPLPSSRLDMTEDGASTLLSSDMFIGGRFSAEGPSLGLLTVPNLALGVRDAEVFGLWKE